MSFKTLGASRMLSSAINVLACSAVLVLASMRMNADTGTCSGQNLTLPFTDVPGTNIFFCSIAQAFFTGLTNGTTPTTYSPSGNVTRDQMAAFITRTQDSALKRGSRRAAAGQWWMPKDVGVLDVTNVGNQPPQYSCFDGEDIWVPVSNGIQVVSTATPARLLATLTGNGISGSTRAVAFDGERIMVTNPGGHSVSLWKASSLTPLGSLNLEVERTPFGVCSDGLNFWISVDLINIQGVLMRF